MAEDNVNDRLSKLEFAVEGFCPNCFQRIRGWEVPVTQAVRSALVGQSIDVNTGHKKNCGLNK